MLDMELRQTSKRHVDGIKKQQNKVILLLKVSWELVILLESNTI